MTRACGLCGEPFEPVRVTNVYCTILCQRRARGARSRKPPWETRPCAQCGVEFEWTPKGSHHRRYCSEACKRRFASLANSRQRWRHVSRRYGLAPEVFDRMLSAQGGRCAICSVVLAGRALDADSPQVDHDHTTGQLRAILCRPCNTALGLFGDDASRIIRAAEYLQSWDPRLALVQ